MLTSLPAPADYALYLGVMTTLALTPGPANLFAIASGVARGPGPALLGVVGMNGATLVWFAAAALGLGALVKAFPAQFHILAIAGALYVGWLGAKSLWSAWRDTAEIDTVVAKGAGSAFWSGFAVQIANPKAILFFTAILPPFLDTDRPLGGQLVAYAAATIALDGLAMSGYAIAGGALADRLREPRFARLFQTLVGLLLLTAAALILIRG